MLLQGYFMKPTVITDLSADSKCMMEEIFGPVACVVPFDSESEVGIIYIVIFHKNIHLFKTCTTSTKAPGFFTCSRVKYN